MAVPSENLIRQDSRGAEESYHDLRRWEYCFVWRGSRSGTHFKSHRQLRAENLALRHQLNVAIRRMPRRPNLTGIDRAMLVWLYRRCPHVLTTVTIVRPETVVRWHRMGFRAYGRWKSRSLGGRPPQAGRHLCAIMLTVLQLWIFSSHPRCGWNGS